jgi:uncharacterized protein YjaG (DUF416 family)
MQEEFDFQTKIEFLPTNHQIAFAASCAEWLVLMYTAFCLTEDWTNDPFILYQNLNAVWEYLKGNRLDEMQFYKMIVESEDAEINPEDYNYFLMYGAMGAAPAVASLLRMCLKANGSLAEQVREIAVDELFNFVCVVNSPSTVTAYTEDFIEEMRYSPLMRSENEKQQHDLIVLEGQHELDIAFLTKFRVEAQNSRLNPFVRRLVPEAIIKLYASAT